MNKSVTPLPDVLSGEIITRPVKLDRALFYLVGGALSFLTDKEPLEQTGILTVDEAKLALSDMLWEFYHGRIDVTPIGGIIEYAGTFPLPDAMHEAGWLECVGGSYDNVNYAPLFEVIGYTFNTGGEGSGIFRVPNLVDLSTMGVGGKVALGETIGEYTHALTASENGQHSHAITDPGHIHSVARGAGGAPNVPQIAVTSGNNASPMSTGSSTTGISIQDSGSGEPHNNIHPVMGMNKIIRAF